MEDSRTDTSRWEKWFTFNRLLLMSIAVLQVVVLIELFRSRGVQHRPDARQDSEPVEIEFLQLPTSPIAHGTPIQGTPVKNPVNTTRDPFMNDPRWNVPWPPSVGRAQDIHDRMNRMLLQRVSTELRQMENLMDFDNGWNALTTSPTMDMRERGDSYEIDFSLPGIDASEIEVALEGRLLTIHTTYDELTPRHRSISQFERKVWLPGPVEGADAAHALVTNGVLKVMIPKALESRADTRPGRIPFGGNAATSGIPMPGNTY